MNVRNRSLLIPYFADSSTDVWQGEQTCAETFFAAVRERGSDRARIVCSPWHVVQTGESEFPLSTAVPCTLCPYVFATSAWHLAHVEGMLARLTNEPGLEPFFMSWLPWQLTQLAALALPFSSSAPWTLWS